MYLCFHSLNIHLIIKGQQYFSRREISVQTDMAKTSSVEWVVTVQNRCFPEAPEVAFSTLMASSTY